MLKKNQAITLIALIITIIVLLVLAGVTINMVLGENGLFNKAKTSVGKYENSQGKENTALSNYESLIDGINSSRDIDTATLKNLIKEVIKEEKIDTTPIGTIIAFSVNSTPSSEYLICNGQSVSKTEYADLYALLGETYGAGDNSNEFKVPDLRGEFLRGAGTATRNTGNGGTVGQHQDATYQIYLYTHNAAMQASEFSTTSNAMGPVNIDSYLKGDATGTQSRIISSTSYWYTEGSVNHKRFASRPTNTSVLYCIKAK